MPDMTLTDILNFKWDDWGLETNDSEPERTFDQNIGDLILPPAEAYIEWSTIPRLIYITEYFCAEKHPMVLDPEEPGFFQRASTFDISFAIKLLDWMIGIGMPNLISKQNLLRFVKFYPTYSIVYDRTRRRKNRPESAQCTIYLEKANGKQLLILHTNASQISGRARYRYKEAKRKLAGSRSSA